MEYRKIYNQLIQKRIDNPISSDYCYVEKHHIVPRSEGGSDDTDNLVNLTAREHYIAHLLLAKIYDDEKMLCALMLMKAHYPKMNGRIFESIKSRLSSVMSNIQKGNKNHLGVHHSTYTRKLISEKSKITSKGNLWWNNGVEETRSRMCPSDGWVRGRITKGFCGKKHSLRTRERISNRIREIRATR